MLSTVLLRRLLYEYNHVFGCNCKWKDPIISDNDKREHKLQEKANKIREQFAAYGLENLLRRVLDESIHTVRYSYSVYTLFQDCNYSFQNNRKLFKPT